MSDFLKKIRGLTEARVQTAKIERPAETFSSKRVGHDFVGALKSGPQPRVIAEVKRASPSRGSIAPDLDPVQVARDYVEAGAAVISVLTEPEYFGGSLQTLREIRAALPKAVLLMKDFVLDSYQLLQAREAGADAVLLMVSLLGEKKFHVLYEETLRLGLTPLVEVHDAAELAVAQAAEAQVIGINNRDLRTLEVSLDVSRELAKLKGASLFISESGIESRADLKELGALGYDGFLIGSALMRTQAPGPALRALLRSSLQIKICGVTRVEDARLAADLGATMIGLIFAEQSPRKVAVEMARAISNSLPPNVLAIGVFTTESELLSVVEQAELAGVQFHSFNPSKELLLELRRRKLILIRAGSTAEGWADLDRALYDHLLLDAAKVPTRATLDIGEVKTLGLNPPFMIAGGLSPENVASYLHELKPTGVDVASGVETSPGIKSETKLRQFFSAIHAVDEGSLK